MARRVGLLDLGGFLLEPGLEHFLSSWHRGFALSRRFPLFSAGSRNAPGGAEIPERQLLSDPAVASALPEGFSPSRPLRERRSSAGAGSPWGNAGNFGNFGNFGNGMLGMSGFQSHKSLVGSLEVPGNLKPQEEFFRDEPEQSPRPARESAPGELRERSGIQAVEQPLPAPCAPGDVTHGHVEIRPGVRLSFAELGRGPALCLCHGFPESWRSWRFQMPALAGAGFRVLALEMKGYGESSAPEDIAEYSQEQICKDFVTFLDKLGLSRVVLVGHDWGGAMAWNVALFYPHRLRAVASLNTPYRPADPDTDIMEKLESSPAFDYQLYFQEPGVAEAELEKDIGRTLKILIRSTSPEDRLPVRVDMRNVRERGGLLAGLPEDPPCSRLLPPPELEFYVRQFQKSGFRGPLNWYRNMRENWRWALSARNRKIPIPALMVTAGKDPVLHPNLSRGMESWIPQLHREHLEDCGHWTQLERPAEVNRILLEWLRKLPPEPPSPGNSKL